mgnify:FL=1|jgi:hypothetical protein
MALSLNLVLTALATTHILMFVFGMWTASFIQGKPIGEILTEAKR